MPRISGTHYRHAVTTCFDCGEKYRPHQIGGGRCPPCAAKLAERFTVYDREKRVGEIPANLKGRS
jgi:hypothetical protein